jgi:hypothetical protein
MLKLRPLPILISGLIAVILLFGGWFAYRSLTVNTPLTSMIAGLPAVENADVQVNGSELNVNLNVGRNADLQAIANKIYTEGASIAKASTVKLNMNGKSSQALDTWWGVTLFDIAQAMETKTYSKIPAALQSHAAKLPGVAFTTSMDDRNVYIKMTYGDAYKIVVLPRTPDKLGVWPNV